jgi:nucleoside-diphosphate-sugar epimerase
MEEVSGLQAVVDVSNPLPAPVPLNYVSDLSLVSHELGWKPSVSLVDGLADLFGGPR